MTDSELEILRFPIGKFIKPQHFTNEIISSYIADIKFFPERIEREVGHLNAEQLDTHYRPNGWTIRQVVHHCADSHMNGYIRFKLALTEENPTIKPYKEALWAELPESKTMAIEPSLQIIEGVHNRWGSLLLFMNEMQLHKTLFHPEHNRELALNEYAGMYAWHCNHHLAHIITLKKLRGWE